MIPELNGIHVGDFIRILRQPQGTRFHTFTGCEGVIDSIWPKGKDLNGFVRERDVFLVKVIQRPEAKKLEPIVSTSGSAHLGDFVVIKLEECRCNHEVLQDLQQEVLRKSQKDDDDLQPLKQNIDRVLRRHRAVALRRKTMGYKPKPNPYLPPKSVRRGDKYDFPSYEIDIEERGLGDRLRRCAVKEKLTSRDRQTMAWINQASGRCSFWHSSKIVRELVVELDLDPYADNFNEALYQDFKHQMVTPDQLRVVVIQALNDGRIVINIDGGKLDKWDNKTECCARDREATHFFVTTAKRRQLPILADPEAKIEFLPKE